MRSACMQALDSLARHDVRHHHMRSSRHYMMRYLVSCYVMIHVLRASRRDHMMMNNHCLVYSRDRNRRTWFSSRLMDCDYDTMISSSCQVYVSTRFIRSIYMISSRKCVGLRVLLRPLLTKTSECDSVRTKLT